MRKRIKDYVKYTVAELEDYTQREGSCVKKIRHKMHLNLQPYALANIRQSVHNFLADKKIGLYDSQLLGIILDIRNIKIMGKEAPIYFGHPNIHLDIEADCYIFQPHIGAVVRGIVKHIAARHIGVIIYRVFNASIRFSDLMDQTIQLNSEIEFMIKSFDLQNIMPFIEGELLAKEVRHTKSETNLNSSNESICDPKDDIKPFLNEFSGEHENAIEKNTPRKGKKRKSSPHTKIIIKKEPKIEYCSN